MHAPAAHEDPAPAVDEPIYARVCTSAVESRNVRDVHAEYVQLVSPVYTLGEIRMHAGEVRS